MRHRLSLVTGPARLPLDINIAKDYLRLGDDQTDDDAMIIALMNTATDHCEQFLRRALITQTWSMFLDQWPANWQGSDWWDGVREIARTELNLGNRFVEVPKPPLQSISLIQTFDDSDNATTYSSDNYFVDTATEPGRVVLRQTATAPLGTRTANRIEIRFVAGYGDDMEDVPEGIRTGMLRLIGHLYECPDDDPDAACKACGAEAMWRPYRILKL